MKKLVALAVAGIFTAPGYAAELTLSGDLEYRYKSGNTGESASYHDSDIKVTATEVLANGLKITAFVEFQDAVSSVGGDSEVQISGSFGTINLGVTDPAVNKVDELADFAPASGDVAAPGIAGTDATSVIRYTLPTLIPGLTLAGSLGYTATVGEESQSIGLKYSTGGATISYGTLDGAATTVTTKYTGVQYAKSGVTVGYDRTTDNGAAGTDTETMGIQYVMGDITLAYEINETDVGGTKTDLDVMGATYAVGGGLKVYLEAADSSTADADTTIVGVLYSF